MYHAIGSSAHDPNQLFTSPERFEAQMRYLKQHGMQGVSVRELVRRVNSGNSEGLVGLTFDDGYKDFLTAAVPVMEKFHFTATVFAVAGMLGRENDWAHTYNPRPRLKLLTAEELRAVAERGMEVGSHSMTHPKLPALAVEQLEKEIRESLQVLSEILGEAVEGFCYPYGSLNSAALRSVSLAGYGYACAWSTHIESSVYELPRIPVSERDARSRFAAKLLVYSHYSRAKRLFWH
jgi:peptidoglycan/xylan/chitin deacetylase (PgdA/CDA1 family)